jgi:hypothetical protein
MRITEKQLYQIIKEERQKLLNECGDHYMYYQNGSGKCGGSHDDYGQEEETGMVSGNLHSLADKAAKLAEMMEGADSIEEWVQEKIAVAESMIDSIFDYMEYNEQDEIEEQSDYVSMDPAHYDEDDYKDDGKDSYDDEYQYQDEDEY